QRRPGCNSAGCESYCFFCFVCTSSVVACFVVGSKLARTSSPDCSWVKLTLLPSRVMFVLSPTLSCCWVPVSEEIVTIFLSLSTEAILPESFDSLVALADVPVCDVPVCVDAPACDEVPGCAEVPVCPEVPVCAEEVGLDFP